MYHSLIDHVFAQREKAQVSDELLEVGSVCSAALHCLHEIELLAHVVIVLFLLGFCTRHCNGAIQVVREMT